MVAALAGGRANPAWETQATTRWRALVADLRAEKVKSSSGKGVLKAAIRLQVGVA